MTLADRIRRHAAEFTPAEHRIAQTLASSNFLAGLETVAKLGQMARVSGATVLRFALKLGFSSYPELQDVLRNDIKERLASPVDLYDRATSLAGLGGVAEEANSIFARGIARTLARIDPATLSRIASALVDRARPVHLVGGRFTHHIAEILWGYLHQIRPGAQIIRSGANSLSDLVIDFNRRDVIVVFDIRRYQMDVVEFAEMAKQKGATVILITDTFLSPISRIANHVVACEIVAPSAQDSLVPCMAVVELLASEAIRLADASGRQRMLDIEKLRGGRESRTISGQPNG